MPKFTFIGSNASGYFQYGELRFDKGVAVEVTDEDTIRRFSNHRDFEGGDPLDHDRDGRKGGSRPDSPPSLTNRNKAQLLEIAAAEGVEIEEGASNSQIVKAIEAARKA